jgi:hypothetical protein
LLTVRSTNNNKTENKEKRKKKKKKEEEGKEERKKEKNRETASMLPKDFQWGFATAAYVVASCSLQTPPP